MSDRLQRGFYAVESAGRDRRSSACWWFIAARRERSAGVGPPHAVRDNLKQLGLALHAYHEANEGSPWEAWTTSSIGPTSVFPEHGSLFVALLPNLDQDALYNDCNFVGNTDYISMTPMGSCQLNLAGRIDMPSDDPNELGGNPL